MLCKITRFRYRNVAFHQRFVSSTTTIVYKDNLPAQAYQPKIVEKYKYNKWERNGLFTAELNNERPNFSMVLPPPNVTGKLHIGHALACTVQDVIARRKRSLGHNVLWLPGIDHAGIATQGVVEKYIKSKYNQHRLEFGREKFNQEVWKWKEEHGDVIAQQLRRLGCSLDWSRQTFTMDPKHTTAVNTAFIRLFQKGLIYRKKALVNWCPQLQSTVSDIEVDSLPVEGPTDVSVHGYDKPIKFGFLYHFAYKVFGSDDEVVVATTMPETMLGDTGVAVHPEDGRYTHLHGQRLVHPFSNTSIPIVLDKFVDRDFGSGAVEVTPAHSKIDYEVAQKHGLPLHPVINEQGVMVNSGQFNNLKKYDCRVKLLEVLQDLGLMRGVKPHQMTLPVCSRTGCVIDYLPKEQWFLSCNELNKKAADAVETGQLNIVPDKFAKYWLDWCRNDRDWCISRQLWWGHQIPAYKCCSEKDVVWVAAENENVAKQQASKFLRTMPNDIVAYRDTDVLDTWFSSGIYPFASLGWPERNESPDYDEFYPLSLMATGHDILGFWVHRMVMLGVELTGQLPFRNVLLHGIICDSKGAKMSKSKGNVIDPIDVINGITLDNLAKKTKDSFNMGVLSKVEMQKANAYHKSHFTQTNGIPECGVDALRFTLLSRDIKSHFVHFDVDLCKINKFFGNKIWQSLKYTQMSFGKLKPFDGEISKEDLSYFDKWILSRMAGMVDVVNTSMDAYDFHIATKALKEFLYNNFCDVYLECTKPGFDGDDIRKAYAHAHTLSAVLSTSLRCLSPFMIYLTEELIPKVPSFERNMIIDYDDATKPFKDFPNAGDFGTFVDKRFESKVEKILNAIALVRQIKALYGVTYKMKPHLFVETKESDLVEDIECNKLAVLHLTGCIDLRFEDIKNKNVVSSILNTDTRLSVEIEGDNIQDIIKERKVVLDNKIRKLEETLDKLENKLHSDTYINNTPEWTQVLDREKLLLKREELKQLQMLTMV